VAAISVAVAARTAPWLRQVGVEDQATVLHLLTKRREDLVGMRTQTLTGCIGCWPIWSWPVPAAT
jgi:hypothetical protein